LLLKHTLHAWHLPKEGYSSGSRVIKKKPSHALWREASPDRYTVIMKRNSSVAKQLLSAAAASPICTYAELQRRIHHDLRVQHPEWATPNGDSSMYDLYERRLAEQIAFFQSAKVNLVAA
jgi:hypothetical protein